MIASFEDASKDEQGARSVPSRLVRCLVNRRRYGQDAMKKARECPASFPISQDMREVEATINPVPYHRVKSFERLCEGGSGDVSKKRSERNPRAHRNTTRKDTGRPPFTMSA